MNGKSKVTVKEFIAMKERERYALELKAPKGANVKHWFYVSGMIDAAKLIKKTFKLK